MIGRLARSLWHGLAGGLLAGSTVGLAEAVWILSQAPTGEYLALVHAALLYGVLGGGLGLLVGLFVALARALWPGLQDPLAYSFSALAVGVGMGAVVLAAIVDRVVYLELGIGAPGLVALVVLWVVVATLGLWLGPVFLTRTPLKILLLPRGSLTAWVSLVALAALFSVSPVEEPGGAAMSPLRPPPPDLVEAPDLLVITVESLRADAWDGPAARTLAEQGTVYTEHRAPSSWTRPSLASLLTSELPAAHGCDVVTARLEADRVTLTEALQDRGFVTGGFAARSELERGFGFDQGFDWLLGMDAQRGVFRSASGRRLMLAGAIRQDFRRLRGVDLVPGDVYRPATEVVAQAERFMAANRDAGNHFMAWLHLAEPALPWFLDDGRVIHDEGEVAALGPAGARAAYIEQVARVDAAVGELLRWLDGRGMLEDMAVVLVGLHGEELFDHGGYGHGQTLYQEVVHTPLVVKLPGAVGRGEQVVEPVRTLDIAPTLANAVGATVPPPWEGEPLPTARREPLPGGPGDRPDRRPVVSQLRLGGAVLDAIEVDGWKLVRANEGNPRHLDSTEVYELRRDPGERSNLVGQAGARQADLSRTLRATLARSASWRTRPPVPGP